MTSENQKCKADDREKKKPHLEDIKVLEVLSRRHREKTHLEDIKVLEV